MFFLGYTYLAALAACGFRRGTQGMASLSIVDFRCL
jgi:hypothetical protein